MLIIGRLGQPSTNTGLGAASPQRPPTQAGSYSRRRNVMPEPSERQILERAYQIWERHGRPEGREDEFFALAQQELRNEDKSNPMRTPETL